MAIDIDAFDHLLGNLMSAPFGADYGYRVTCTAKRGRFRPDATIEWYGEILDDDENAPLGSFTFLQFNHASNIMFVVALDSTAYP